MAKQSKQLKVYCLHIYERIARLGKFVAAKEVSSQVETINACI